MCSQSWKNVACVESGENIRENSELEKDAKQNKRYKFRSSRRWQSKKRKGFQGKKIDNVRPRPTEEQHDN